MYKFQNCGSRAAHSTCCSRGLIRGIPTFCDAASPGDAGGGHATDRCDCRREKVRRQTGGRLKPLTAPVPNLAVANTADRRRHFHVARIGRLRLLD